MNAPSPQGNFGQFNLSQGWRDNFARKLAHKGADMPDDMDIKIRNGLGWKEMAVLAVAGLGVGHLLTRPEPDPNTPPAQIAPADREYEIIHRDGAGNIIDIQQWTGIEE